MNKVISKNILSLMFVLMFTIAFAHALHPAAQALTSLSHPLNEIGASALVGGVNWGQIGAGLACGAGIVAIAGGALSGVGTPAAILAVSGVAGCCVAAIG